MNTVLLKKEKLECMAFEDKLNCLDIYRVREVEKEIRKFMDLPVNRSLRIEIKNIMKAVDKMTNEQFDLIDTVVENLLTYDDLV